MTVLEIAEKVREGELTPLQALEPFLRRMETREHELNCYITPRMEEAVRQAEQLSEPDRRAGMLLPGVPVAVKDNLCTKGLRTTAGSAMLQHYVPPYTATAVKRLMEAGAVLLGKTNMDEFGFGSSTETSFFGPSRNPFDPERTPGGSSGGSAAAVASGEAAAALGSDTGGSVRQPAAFTGIVGMKPSYGAVSRYGLIAYASSLDQVGILSRTAADAALLLRVISGRDPMDSTSTGIPGEWVTGGQAPENLRGCRLGFIRELFEAADTGVRNACFRVMDRLREEGAEIHEIRLPVLQEAAPVYYTIACAEASSNLARYDGVKYGRRTEPAETLRELILKSRQEGFGEEVRRRILLGTYVLSEGFYEEYYRKALRIRRLIAEEFRAPFAESDALLLPGAASVAPRLGEFGKDPLRSYRADLMTVPANLLGSPAVSIPCGGAFPETGERVLLPVGLQLMGAPGTDWKLLRLAAAAEACLTEEVREIKEKLP